jgi:transketolase
MTTDLNHLATDIRRLVIQQSKKAHVGHIGSCLSIADILAALYGGAVNAESLDDHDRDRVILSKGHAALALYAALNASGRMDDAMLATFCEDGTSLGTHPEHVVPGIDVSTGSLGHGLSIGVGAALAAKLEGSSRRVFVVLSDAECNEGAVWEAVMFAAQHRLDGVTAIVDVNGQQALGYTRDVIDLDPLGERFASFGWAVAEADGTDPGAIAAALAEEHGGRPRVVIANTVFGRGVSYMESRIEWHYWPMDDDQYRQALEELDAGAR